MSEEATRYFDIPLEVFGTGICDAGTFNAAMEKLDTIFHEGDIFGHPSWKPPVADFAALPGAGATVGDIRQTLDNGATYRWDGTRWVTATHPAIVDEVSTGYVSGGEVTRGSGLDIDVAAGTGYSNDNNELLSTITWGAITLTMPANSLKNIVVNASGVVSLEDPPADFKNELTLASATSDATDVVLLAKHYADVVESTGRYHEYFRDIIGSVAVTGLLTHAHVVPLRLEVDAGVYYLSDFKVTVPGTSPITFTYWYQDGSGGWTKTSGQTLVDTANYDGGGGALIPVPGGEYKKDLLFIGYSDDGPEYHLVYGQETFTSQTDAERGDIPVAAVELVLATARSAGVVSLSGASVIASAVDHRVFLGQQTLQLSGPVDHGDLSGLAHDDHPQYLLRSDLAAYPREASATAATTTTGATDALLAGMTLTPGAGDYMVWFSTTVDHDSTGETIWVSLYVNGVQVAHTERESRRGGAAGDLQTGLAFNAHITGVLAGQVVEVRWRTTAATASCYERTLNLLKVA